MTGFFAALAFLTRLPGPRLSPEDAGNLGRAAPWLAVVGALVGLLVAIAAALGATAGPWIGALAGLLVWVIVTGALHLDGLADVADGLGAAHGNPERFLAVARDPNIGSFGAIAIALQLIAKLVLLTTLVERADVAELVAGLALAGAWARWTPLAVGRAVPPLAEGLASRFHTGIDARITIIEALVLGGLSIAVAPALLVALPFAALYALYWRRRLGGITGDGHGAGIELQESLLLAALVLV
jgi:adenosylcobinamide-GDP ribazoletransferase